MRLGLIRGNADFRRLWTGDAISQLGTQVSALAVPLVAVVTLHATAFEVGLLAAAHYLPFLLIGLPAGAWVDRARRRPVMIVADLSRAVLLASVTVAAALHRLSLAQLVVVVFAIGVATAFFDVAHMSYVPRLVGRDRLVEANARLEASASTAYAVGPALAGALVQALTAPLAVLADAASFVWSASWIGAIRDRERRGTDGAGGMAGALGGPGGAAGSADGAAGSADGAARAAGSAGAADGAVAVTGAARGRLAAEIGEGLRLVLGHPALRALSVFGAASVLFLSAERALETLFLVRTVGLTPAAIGAVDGIGALGAVTGAFVARPLRDRLGDRRTMTAAMAICSVALLLMPFAATGPRLVLYVSGGAVSSCGIVVFNIVSSAFRQAFCPNALLARMAATMRFVGWGTAPVGSLLGGIAAGPLGVRATMWIAGAGFLAATVYLTAVPLDRYARLASDVPEGSWGERECRRSMRLRGPVRSGDLRRWPRGRA